MRIYVHHRRIYVKHTLRYPPGDATITGVDIDDLVEQDETLFPLEERPHLPVGLTAAIEAGTCVLFVGAGVGGHARNDHGNVAPDGETLARDIATRFHIAVDGDFDLPTIARIAELRAGRPERIRFRATSGA